MLEFNGDSLRFKESLRRWDGRGSKLVAVLPYAYCLGIRSSRRMAGALERDVGFRAETANQSFPGRRLPDPVPFGVDHEAALERLFVHVLRLCWEAGLVKLRDDPSMRQGLSSGRLIPHRGQGIILTRETLQPSYRKERDG